MTINRIIEIYMIEIMHYILCLWTGQYYYPVFPNKPIINIKIPIIGGIIICCIIGGIVYILCFIITGHYGNAPEHIEYVTKIGINGGLLQ